MVWLRTLVRVDICPAERDPGLDLLSPAGVNASGLRNKGRIADVWIHHWDASGFAEIYRVSHGLHEEWIGGGNLRPDVPSS